MIYLLRYSPFIISAGCLWALLSAIVLNIFFSQNNKVEKVKKSVVETGSMFAFFLLMATLAFTNVGKLYIHYIAVIFLQVLGTIMIVTGTVINIIGRLRLGSNWGNQIRIYENHTLVTGGIYKYIRHPLYSSTILMMYGFSLLFINPLVFVLNSIIFLPFMIYRARQEDVLLYATFGDSFTAYKAKTGMLIPKFIIGRKTNGKNGQC